MNDTTNIDNSNDSHHLHPNPNNQNSNDNPEDNDNLVGYDNNDTDIEINDQGLSNNTNISDRSSINDSSRTVSNKNLKLIISMKKLNRIFLPLKINHGSSASPGDNSTQNPWLTTVNHFVVKIH